MKPQFHPTLVNGPLGDPAVFVDFLFERRALLFDLGEVASLPPRKILRLSHVFISHTHMDHFIGFDHLVRICLGREKKLRLFGPPGFLDQVWHRLAAYTWNLVENYPSDFTIAATELHPDGKALAAEFHCRSGFRGEGNAAFTITEGVLLDEESFRVRSVFLDHKIPSLAYTLEEKNHVNIMKNRLDELGFPVGAWLAELKRAVLRDEPGEKLFRIWWRENGRTAETWMPLGDLRSRVLRVVPGQKITYVTDAVYSGENAEKIVALARGADYLFIEASFLHEEAERAAVKCHLTARQAGELARRAGAVRVTPFHFSPRYTGMEERLTRELEEAFMGNVSPSGDYAAKSGYPEHFS
jgi:ribonuclease Z